MENLSIFNSIACATNFQTDRDNWSVGDDGFRSETSWHVQGHKGLEKIFHEISCNLTEYEKSDSIDLGKRIQTLENVRSKLGQKTSRYTRRRFRHAFFRGRVSAEYAVVEKEIADAIARLKARQTEDGDTRPLLTSSIDSRENKLSTGGNKAPVTKAPVTKASVTKAPVTKAPVTKAPVTKEQPKQTQVPEQTFQPVVPQLSVRDHIAKFGESLATAQNPSKAFTSLLNLESWKGLDVDELAKTILEALKVAKKLDDKPGRRGAGEYRKALGEMIKTLVFMKGAKGAKGDLIGEIKKDPLLSRYVNANKSYAYLKH